MLHISTPMNTITVLKRKYRECFEECFNIMREYSLQSRADNTSNTVTMPPASAAQRSLTPDRGNVQVSILNRLQSVSMGLSHGSRVILTISYSILSRFGLMFSAGK